MKILKQLPDIRSGWYGIFPGLHENSVIRFVGPSLQNICLYFRCFFWRKLNWWSSSFLFFSRFIGELFKLKMLTENIMHDCVFKLLRTKDPENLECLCRLLTTIGKELDVDKAKVCDSYSLTIVHNYFFCNIYIIPPVDFVCTTSKPFFVNNWDSFAFCTYFVEA